MYSGIRGTLAFLGGFAALSAVTGRLQARQCQATLDTAATVATQLQTYYVASTGQYNQGELWTDSNAVEDLHNLMLAAGTTTWASVGDTSRIGKAAEDPSTNWADIISGSNDDAQWIILALWKIADYRAAHQQSIDAFMNAAGTIYDIIAAEYDNTCGGGVWWSSAHTYKNAITNELFLLTSAEGFQRTNDQKYLTNANNVWNWLNTSGMRNSDGLYNDGLDSNTCQNNGQTTWTYNQGVIASGLAALYAATGSSNTELLDIAEVTLDATITHLTVNNVLKESCDDATSSTCDHDQQIFKGIWTKHLQYYLDKAADPARTSKYSAFLGAQSSAAFHFGKRANNDVGSVWYAPDQGGSIFSPEATTSGMAAFVAAAKYGPC
ncbi:Six-hairpin glycosidase [Amylostereum chailletii]|nr:Six-hairpin glycosidase [Amylostereum chailletii]